MRGAPGPKRGGGGGVNALHRSCASLRLRVCLRCTQPAIDCPPSAPARVPTVRSSASGPPTAHAALGAHPSPYTFLWDRRCVRLVLRAPPNKCPRALHSSEAAAVPQPLLISGPSAHARPPAAAPRRHRARAAHTAGPPRACARSAFYGAVKRLGGSERGGSG